MKRSEPRRRVVAASKAIAVLLLAAGCKTLGTSGLAVTFTTDPPGARVIVNEMDSGFVTPCRLALPKQDRHQVELVMPGYAPVALRVRRERDADVILWRDMSLRPVVWRFPLWLNMEDSLEPFKFMRVYEPGHVFVRLERAGDQ